MNTTIPGELRDLPISCLDVLGDDVAHQYRHESSGQSIWRFGTLLPDHQHNLFKPVNVNGAESPYFHCLGGYFSSDEMGHQFSPERLSQCFVLASSDTGDLMFIDLSRDGQVFRFNHETCVAKKWAANFDNWIKRTTPCHRPFRLPDGIPSNQIPDHLFQTWKPVAAKHLSFEQISELPFLEIGFPETWVEKSNLGSATHEFRITKKKPMTVVLYDDDASETYLLQFIKQIRMIVFDPETKQSISYDRVRK